MKVLVVDDDNTSRKLLAHYLSTMDIPHTTGSSACDAMRKFRNSPFDMVISDWVMPGENGLELCRNIRERENGKHTFFMCLTALNDLDALEKAINEGIDFYLTKPVEPESLKRGVALGRRILQIHSSETGKPDLDELPWQPDEFETVLRNSFKAARKTGQSLSLAATRFPHMLDTTMDPETREIVSGLLCNYDHTISPGGSNVLVIFRDLDEQQFEQKLATLRHRLEHTHHTLRPAICATSVCKVDESPLDMVRRTLSNMPVAPKTVFV